MSKGGFNCEFTFEPLECQMCHKYLRDPQTVSCCKRNFCKICIEQVKEHKAGCPSCSKTFIYNPYVKFNEVLLQFNVFCAHNCGWSGPLKEHDDHMNIDPPCDKWLEGCPTVEVQCIYCKVECKHRKHYLQCLERKFQLSKLSCVYDITCIDEVCSKWEVIGEELSLRRSKLQAIKQARGINDQKNAYQEMLKQWIESTNLPSWRKLLSAFRKSTVNLQELAGNIEQGLLCDLGSKQQVTQLIKEAEDIKQEYRLPQAQFHQLAHTKDQIQKCQKALQDKIGYLEFEENIKLLEQGLEENQRNPHTKYRNSSSTINSAVMAAALAPDMRSNTHNTVLTGGAMATASASASVMRSTTHNAVLTGGAMTAASASVMRSTTHNAVLTGRAMTAEAMVAGVKAVRAAMATIPWPGLATGLGGLRGMLNTSLSASFFKSEDQTKRERIIANYDDLIKRCEDAISEIRFLTGE